MIALTLNGGVSQSSAWLTPHDALEPYVPEAAPLSTDADTQAHHQPVWRPRFNPWLIAVAVSLAAFMEILDTSIANVALPHIAGSLGAGTDESTWVLTSYLVSNAIVLPITGWLVGVFGRKRLFLTCISLFTVSSLLCGIAPSLGILLFARIIQGIGGGGMQPMAQAILADSFPPRQRGAAFAVYAVTVIFAPAIGPTLGGWITDNYTWHWIFLINLPVGILALALVRYLIDDPPFLTRTTGGRVDYIGFGLLALGVGALQVMLDKGQQDDWFSSHFITALAAIAVVCLTVLVFWEWFQKEPIVDVRLFKSVNFSATCLMMFFVGAVSFAGIVLMPQYLQTLMGYPAQTAGLVLSLGALVLFIEMPIVGQLASQTQARYLIAFGWLTAAMAMYHSAKTINLSMSFGTAAWLRTVQSFPLPFIFIPATMAGYVGLPREKSNVVAGLVNFMRNVGSSVGTSLVMAVLARRAQVHQTMLASYTSPGDPNFQAAISGLSAELGRSGFPPAEARNQAYARIYAVVRNQASAMAYVDAFWLLAVGSAVMCVLAFLLKRNDPRQESDVVAH